MSRITIADLAGVVYSSGKVFNGLSTGRVDTESFLRSGSTDGIVSRPDLALLLDLRDASGFIIERAENRSVIDGAYVRALNRTLRRSAALHPGAFRTDDQGIGVRTDYGRHEPAALDEPTLDRLIASAIKGTDPRGDAVDLFVDLAKAQPFEDGNKRTALFAANGVLLREKCNAVLTIPVDENDPSVSARFNDLLARAYIHDERDGVKSLLRRHGFQPLADRDRDASRM
ncbi:MAG: Fic family protein [Rhodoglobus sp.]